MNSKTIENRWYSPLLVAASVLCLFVGLSVYNSVDRQNFELNSLKNENLFLKEKIEHQGRQADTIKIELEKLKETHPYSSPKWRNKKTGLCTEGTFFGFLLYTPVDTTICPQFANVLEDYKGPTAKVNSVRRKGKRTSQHFHGKAIDLAWDENVIAFLLSEEGKSWLDRHSLTLYIEGKPGSKRVKKYLNDPVASEYVFFNPEASGDHIHLNI